jgi:pentatricopeptide repeat protein
MDLYAREGNVAIAQSMFEHLESPNVLQYCLLIKAYGVHGQPDRAEFFIRQMLLEGSKVNPNLATFNTLLNAWAINPSIPDAPNRALAVIRFMDHDLKCIQVGLQPDVVSFNTVLKCLATTTSASNLAACAGAASSTAIDYSSPSEVGKFAEDILNEMVERFRNGNRTVLPDVISYNSCIQACANVGDASRAEVLLTRMKKFGVSPNLRTYNNIFLLYAQLGTVSAAQKAEQLLLELKKMSKTNPSLTPDVYSYNLIFKAMCNSGDPQMYEQILPTYQAMRQVDGIQPDLVMYTFLIAQLSKLGSKEHLEHATALLEDMEQNHANDFRLRPDQRHYMAVVDSWMNRDIRTASTFFLRFVHNFTRGYTGNDPPTQEGMHRIVQGWIKTGNLKEAANFIEKLESFSTKPVKKVYKSLPDGPGLECYRDLLAAWVASTSEDAGYSQLRNQNVMKLRSKLKEMLNVGSMNEGPQSFSSVT